MVLNLAGQKSVRADFGFGPCCSGATCGIIPCDASCGGKAFDNFGDKVSSLIEQVSTSTNSLSRESLAANTSAATFYGEVGTAYQLNHTLFITGWDAIAIKSEVGASALSITIKTFFEQVTNTVTQSIKQATQLEAFRESSNLYSEQSQNDFALSFTSIMEAGLRTEINADSITDDTFVKLNNIRALKAELVSSYQAKKAVSTIAGKSKLLPYLLNIGGGEEKSYNELMLISEASHNYFDERAYAFLIGQSEKTLETGQSRLTVNHGLVAERIANVSAAKVTSSLNVVGLKRRLSLESQLSNALTFEYLSTRKQRNAVRSRRRLDES